MAEQEQVSQPQPKSNANGITRITVGGFKSIAQEQSIEIRPLTILAGANSSGKSSIMQPLLLLKQTLEAPYDPGALLLNGPNVTFTLVDQLLSRTSSGKPIKPFHTGIEIAADSTVTTYFKRDPRKGFDVEETVYTTRGEQTRLFMGMSQDEMRAIYSRSDMIFASLGESASITPVITQDRCFLKLNVRLGDEKSLNSVRVIWNEASLKDAIQRIIHLPGLRGSPERNYPITAVGPTFPGTFEYYVASMIEQWQLDNEHEKLGALNHDLARLGLTKKVVARRIDATQIELLVNRFLSRKGSAEDMISIADVGFGVSQALPVVVSLHAADEGQLVYIEQPEIHLHPRAQVAMAEVLADAVLWGKRLVVETHSSLLLRGVQTLVAERKLPPDLVKLHWFTQREDGSTQIDSADLDETGAFGDWPEDFDSVVIRSENRYLDAAEARLSGE